jgi:hypothetical protein
MGFSVTTQLDIAICDFKFSIRHFDLPNLLSQVRRLVGENTQQGRRSQCLLGDKRKSVLPPSFLLQGQLIVLDCSLIAFVIINNNLQYVGRNHQISC